MSKRTLERRSAAVSPRPKNEARKQGRSGSVRSPVDPQRIAAMVVVAIAALVMAVPAFANAFSVDDLAQIVNAERLHGLSHSWEILTNPYWAPPHVPDLYRPVSSLLLAFQYTLGGGDPIAFRLASAILYVAVCVSFFRLAADFVDWRLALAGAVLFAVHPVHVEAVASAVGQGELIVALLALYSVRTYRRARIEHGVVPAAVWVKLILAYVVAALTKENGLVLPGFLAAAELTIANEEDFATRARTLWFGYLMLAVAALGVVGLRTMILGGGVSAPIVSEALRGSSLWGRTQTMLAMVPQWIRLLFWPAHLRVDYRPPEFDRSVAFGAAEGLGLFIVAGLVVVAIATRRRWAVISFAIAALFVALFPVSNIVVPSAILLAERTLFLPSVWMMLAVVGAVQSVRITERRELAIPALAAVAVLSIAGAVRSVARVGDWHDQGTILARSVIDSPRDWRVWQGYGQTLFDQRRTNEAIDATNRAIELAPVKWEIRNDLAVHLHLVGRDAEAVDLLHQSLAEQPKQVIAVAELPASLIALGRYEEAKHLADSVIIAEGAPPLMVWMRQVADSAIRNNIPAGRIHIGVRTR